MTRYASRRARPDLLPIKPKQIAPNRNHGVLSANPENAVSKRATPSIQKRKQPRMPATPRSSTCVIEQAIMNRLIASALCASGSMPSGNSQNPAAPAARIASRIADRRSTAVARGTTGGAGPAGASTICAVRAIARPRPLCRRTGRRASRAPSGTLPPFWIVADHDHRLAVLGRERLQEVGDDGGVGGVEVAGRLV